MVFSFQVNRKCNVVPSVTYHSLVENIMHRILNCHRCRTVNVHDITFILTKTCCMIYMICAPLYLLILLCTLSTKLQKSKSCGGGFYNLNLKCPACQLFEGNVENLHILFALEQKNSYKGYSQVLSKVFRFPQYLKLTDAKLLTSFIAMITNNFLLVSKTIIITLYSLKPERH